MEKENEAQEKINQRKKIWEHFSLAYYESISQSNVSIMSSLISLTRVYKKYTILDAGCGPGLGTKLICLDAPNENSSIYAFDFCGEMVKFCKSVFENFKDFNCNPDNYWEVSDNLSQSSNKINITEDLMDLRKTKIGKIVKFFEGCIENLPFEDEQFDVYLSSLCLMISSDRLQALKEAYRVLKPGGCAAFSIWGKKEETKLAFKIIEEVLNKYGLQSNRMANFEVSSDIAGLRSEFAEAGFSDVRMEYTNTLFDCYNEQDYLMKFQGPDMMPTLEKINDDKVVKEILEEVKDKAREQLAEQKAIPVHNILVIVAFKE